VILSTIVVHHSEKHTTRFGPDEERRGEGSESVVAIELTTCRAERVVAEYDELTTTQGLERAGRWRGARGDELHMRRDLTTPGLSLDLVGLSNDAKPQIGILSRHLEDSTNLLEELLSTSDSGEELRDLPKCDHGLK
jgi:hypothetical protein